MNINWLSQASPTLYQQLGQVLQQDCPVKVGGIQLPSLEMSCNIISDDTFGDLLATINLTTLTK